MSYFAVDDSNVRLLAEEAANLMTTGARKDHWFAFLDTAFDHDRRPLMWNKPCSRLYREGRMEALATLSPILLQLSSPGTAALEEKLLYLIRHSSGRPMLSFLQSEMTAPDLTERLQHVLEVQTTDRQPYLLRLADTRVAQAMAVALSREHWGFVTRDVDCWIVVNRRAQLERLDLPSPVAASATPRKPIVLSDSELEELLRLGEPDALTQSLYEGFPDLLPSKDRGTFHQTMLEVCAFARQHRVTSFPELVSLAVAVLTTEVEFLQHPHLAAWLDARGWERGEFEEGLATLMELSE